MELTLQRVRSAISETLDYTQRSNELSGLEAHNVLQRLRSCMRDAREEKTALQRYALTSMQQAQIMEVQGAISELDACIEQLERACSQALGEYYKNHR